MTILLSHFETKKLLADENHISRFEFDLALDLYERAVAATFISQHKRDAALYYTFVSSRHKSVVREGDLTVASTDQRFVTNLVDIAGLSALHHQMQPTS